MIATQGGREMNNRQQVFVSEYLKCWNSSEAARRAGYNGRSDVIGSRLLGDVSIKAEIETRLSEIKMSSGEVLVRLANMGRSNIADFAHISKGSELIAMGDNAAVVKKFKHKKYYPKDADPYDEIEIELYDAQSPLINIGKQHGLFSDHHIVETRVAGEVDALLDILKETLPSELYDNVLARLGGKGAGAAKDRAEQGGGGE